MTWAGIPRKARHIRMLFRRPITPGRKVQLKRFWDDASSADAEQFVLGPTAIVVAIQEEPKIQDGKIDLGFDPIVDLEGDRTENLTKLVDFLYPNVAGRLSAEQRDVLEEFAEDPFGAKFPDIAHDYVFEFALQMSQIKEDPRRFLQERAIDPQQLNDIVVSMEALSRPALVVDGQHRLWGAASAENQILLP